MKRIAGAMLLAWLVLILSCTQMWAQATAQISGTAKDQSGAVLPGVEITATQTGTAIARTVVTNETGSYVLTNLPIGPYKLEASLPSFNSITRVNPNLYFSPPLAAIQPQDHLSEHVALPRTQ